MVAAAGWFSPIRVKTLSRPDSGYWHKECVIDSLVLRSHPTGGTVERALTTPRLWLCAPPTKPALTGATHIGWG
jgi:hypothetical protein